MHKISVYVQRDKDYLRSSHVLTEKYTTFGRDRGSEINLDTSEIDRGIHGHFVLYDDLLVIELSDKSNLKGRVRSSGFDRDSCTLLQGQDGKFIDESPGKQLIVKGFQLHSNESVHFKDMRIQYVLDKPGVPAPEATLPAEADSKQGGGGFFSRLFGR